MFSVAKQHLMAKIAAAPVTETPFPHMRVDEAFPPDFYVEIQRNLLPDEEYVRLVDTGRVSAGYSPNRYCFMQSGHRQSPEAPAVKFWEQLFAVLNDKEFLDGWVRRFAPAVRQRLALDLRDLDGGQDIGVGAEVFLMRDKDGYSLWPHVDARSKAMTALFYLPPTDVDAGLGTSLYQRLDESVPVRWGARYPFKGFNLIETIPYRPNSMLAFPNLPTSFHGVEPLVGGSRARDLMIYDVKYRLPEKAKAVPDV